MSDGDEHALAAAEFAKSIWQETAACLEEQKTLLYEEIRCYPTPIAACDQQFNDLLERQARISDELRQVREAIGQGATSTDALAVLTGFINSSRCIDGPMKQQIQSRIRMAP